MELSETWGWIKKHPYTSAGCVFIGGAILVYLYYSSGSAPAQAAATDPNAAYLAQEQIQTQYSAQLQQQATAAQVANAQVAGQVQVAQLGATVQGQSIAASQTLGLAGIAAQQTVDLANIGAQTSIAAITTAGQAHQTDDMMAFLMDQVNQQFGFLNNQASLQAGVLTAQLLSNSEFNQLEGQFGGLANYTTNAVGSLSTGLGNLSNYTTAAVGNLEGAVSGNADVLNHLGSVLASTFPWNGTNGGLFTSDQAAHV